MTQRNMHTGALLSLLTAASLVMSAQTGGLPAPLSGFADQGRFVRYVDGRAQGTIGFCWLANGTIEIHREIPAGAPGASGATKVAVDADGRWLTISHDTPAGLVVATRTARTTRSSC